jgi:hypothetical protein
VGKATIEGFAKNRKIIHKNFNGIFNHIKKDRKLTPLESSGGIS